MKLYVKVLLIFVLILTAKVFAQQEDHRWKPLVVNDSEKIWYDTTTLKNIEGDKFDLWILEMYRPPLQFEQIKGDVYRTKTMYMVDLKTVKYGIAKVVYYDVENNEIFRYDYGIAAYSEDLRYSYPILEKSLIYKVLKAEFNLDEENKSGVK